MRWSMTAIGFVAATLATSACSGDGTGTTARVAGAITAVSGDAQTDTVVGTLPNRLVVQVADQQGNVLPGAAVTWSTLDGILDSTTTHTDAGGQASAAWTLGATPGPMTATATVAGLAAVTFHASARVGAPAAIYFSGNGQLAAAGTPLAAPILVLLKDRFGNPVPGATVNWSVLSGGGSLGASTTTTDTTGQAQVTWTLGPTPGPNSAKASRDSLQVLFSATGT